MQYMLYYFFLNDAIKRLEKKYQDEIADVLNRTFIYSYLLEIPLYYKLFSYRKTNFYNLYHKLHNDKIAETLACLSQEIKENDHDKNYMLILYAYICDLLFSSFTKCYVEAITKPLLKLPLTPKAKVKKYYASLNMISSQFYYERKKQKIKKLKPYKEFITNLTYLDKEKKLVEKILSEIYFFSFGQSFYNRSLKNYLFTLKHYTNDSLGIKKFYLSLREITARPSTFSPRSMSNFGLSKNIFKTDFLNYKKRKWQNGNDSFNEAYEKLLSFVSNILNQVSKEIYYGKGIKKDSITAIIDLKKAIEA